MRSTLKLTRIGNSQGIRLSKQLLGRYAISDTLELETTPDSIILRAPSDARKTWESTYREMAEANEGWSDWDAVAEDGLKDGN